MRVICVLPESRDLKKIGAFIESAYRLTPDICLRQGDLPAVFLEIAKCKLLYSEKTVMARVRFLLKRFNMKAKISLANDLPTALSFAFTGEVSIKKLPLSVLSFYSDPLALDSDTEKSMIRIEKELTRLDLKNLEEFSKLPLRAITNRLGAIAEKCWRRLNSVALLQSIPRPKWTPPEFIEEQVLLHENETCTAVEPLLFSCRTPLDRVMARVQGRALKVTRLQLILRCERRSSVLNSDRVFDFKFMYPQGGLIGVLPVIRERLSRELQVTPIESPVIGLSARVIETVAGRHGQKNFFNSTEEAREELMGLLERLTEKLGPTQVFYAQTIERYFPEKSWQKLQNPPEGLAVNSMVAFLPYGERPLRLLGEPLPLHRVGRNLMSGNRRWCIRKVHGPERVHGEWWNDDHPRDYYRIQTDSIDLWAFRGGPANHSSNRELFLHGFFGDETRDQMNDETSR